MSMKMRMNALDARLAIIETMARVKYSFLTDGKAKITLETEHCKVSSVTELDGFVRSFDA